MRELHCETCGDEMPFEAPPCMDGHGPDCPELACTGCGSALLVGSSLPLALVPTVPTAPSVGATTVTWRVTETVAAA